MDIANRADVARRIVAAGADFMLALVLFLIMLFLTGPVIASLITSSFLLLRDALPIPSLCGASPGKFLLQIRAVQSKGERCDRVASVKRNILPAAFFIVLGVFRFLFEVVPFIEIALATLLAWLIGGVAILMETYKILTDEKGDRIGDLLAGTLVVVWDSHRAEPKS